MNLQIFETDQEDRFVFVVTDGDKSVFDCDVNRQQLAQLRQNIAECLYSPLVNGNCN